MVRKIKAYGRSKRKLQIIEQLLIWNENGYATEATTNMVAKALEIEPTSHLIGILNEMVREGDLCMEYREKPGRFMTAHYYLSPQHLSRRNVTRRKIAVKSRGVAVGQLEMFS